jgi:hypothetical protein
VRPNVSSNFGSTDRNRKGLPSRTPASFLPPIRASSASMYTVMSGSSGIMVSLRSRMLRKSPLPIDALLPQILGHLCAAPNLVLEAAPGAGKTTRVPPALLEFGPLLVLEPRRVAARMSARRVAQEMGEPLGETVGYQVRFEESAGPPPTAIPHRRVLTRRLLHDGSCAACAIV